MPATLRFKRIGFVGVVEGKPDFDQLIDEYCEAGISVRALNIFKKKKEAKRRYEAILPVYIPTLEEKK